MDIKIYHASTSDGNSTPGDGSGREVREDILRRDDFEYIIRPVDPRMAADLVRLAAEAVANDKIGYSMDVERRNTLLAEYKRAGSFKAISRTCDCDCSSFLWALAYAAGAAVDTRGNSATTWTIREELLKTGDFTAMPCPHPAERHILPGDMLVKEHDHCILIGSSAWALAPRTVSSFGAPRLAGETGIMEATGDVFFREDAGTSFPQLLDRDGEPVFAKRGALLWTAGGYSMSGKRRWWRCTAEIGGDTYAGFVSELYLRRYKNAT